MRRLRQPATQVARWHVTLAMLLAAFALLSTPNFAVPVAFVGFLVAPRAALPAAGVVLVKNLGVAQLAGPMLGQMNLTDICLTLFVARSLGSLSHDLRNPPMHLLASGAFLSWSLIVTLIEGVSATPLLRIALYVLAGFCVARDPQARRTLEYVIVGYAGIELLLSLPTLPARLFGPTIGDPAQFGGLMLVAATVVVLRVRPLFVRLPLVAYLATGALLTQTRSIWFAAAAVAVLMFLRGRGRLLPVAVPALGALIGLPLVPWLTRIAHLNRDSGYVRADSLQSSLDAVRNHPFTGQGWAYLSGTTIDPLNGGVGAYNLWLNVTASTGLVGLVLFTAWMIFVARDLGRVDKVGYTVLTIMLAMGLSEMPIYAGALLTIVFILLMSPPADNGRVDVPYPSPSAAAEVTSAASASSPLPGSRGG